MDQATYIGPVAVKQTETKGRGLFLTTAVKAGDLLLCEKAFCHAHAEGRSSNITLLMHPETNRAVMGGQADLIKHIVQKLHRNPSLAPEFDTLYHGNYQGVSVTRVDAQTVVDT